MIALALLLAAGPPQSAVEAERAFAAMAQTHGQWTAFRAFAAPEAVMFTPERVDAPQFLKPLKNPTVAVMWWPANSWVSCDGTVAVNTGPWVREGGRSVGYFTTVWAREPDGSWKWLLDHGDELRRPRPAGEQAAVRKAQCIRGKPRGKGFVELAMDDRSEGRSIDESLRWSWKLLPGGARHLDVELWTGEGYEKVVEDRVAAR